MKRSAAILLAVVSTIAMAAPAGARLADYEKAKEKDKRAGVWCPPGAPISRTCRQLPTTTTMPSGEVWFGVPERGPCWVRSQFIC